jgi:hypothetical protein
LAVDVHALGGSGVEALANFDYLLAAASGAQSHYAYWR